MPDKLKVRLKRLEKSKGELLTANKILRTELDDLKVRFAMAHPALA
jgi:hypothetical protein